MIPNSDPAQRLAGKNATPVLVKSIEEEWGFDDSLPDQYLTMMKKIFTGELISYAPTSSTSTNRIVEGIPATLLALHRRRGDLALLRHPLRLPLGDQGRAAGSTGC